MTSRPRNIEKILFNRPFKIEEYIMSFLRCPICSRVSSIWILKDFLDKKNGTIKLPVSSPFCKHNFISYIDIKGTVQGYIQPNLVFTSSEDYVYKKETFQNKEDVFNNLIKGLTFEIFYKLFRCCLLNIPIYCITEEEYFKENLSLFFGGIFKNLYDHPIKVLSKSRYNMEYAHNFIDLKNIFITNCDLKVIIKEPNYFSKRFKFTSYHLEKSIIEKSKKSFVDKFDIIAEFKSSVDFFFEFLSEISYNLKAGILKEEKVLKNILYNNNLKMDNNLNRLMQNRFDIDLAQFFVIEFIERLSS